MADTEYNAEEAAELKKKRAFRKFSYRGIDLDQLLDLSSEELRDVVRPRPPPVQPRPQEQANGPN